MSSSRLSNLGFRFAAIYFLVYSAYVIPHPFAFVFELLWAPAWEVVLSGVGVGLGLDAVSFVGNGSGDATAFYLHSLAALVLALVGCGVWTGFARDRESPRLRAWMRVWARYWLAAFMIGYGVYKIFPLQFPPPDLVRLTQTYGDSSPMGLVWTFMGHSQAYTAFGGAAELLGGVLLLGRRTTTLGALVCAGVMANVVAINFCYDVPVKLFSSHLLAVALVIAALDGRRLWNVFVLGQAALARETPPILPERPRLRMGLKVGFLVGMVAMLAIEIVLASMMVNEPNPAVYGVYQAVDDPVECGAELPAAGVECSPIRQVVFGKYGGVAIDRVAGPRVMASFDEQAGMLTLRTDDELEAPIWTLETDDEGSLILEGRLGAARHRVTLRAIEVEMLLRERGFHWINEAPFNR